MYRKLPLCGLGQIVRNSFGPGVLKMFKTVFGEFCGPGHTRISPGLNHDLAQVKKTSTKITFWFDILHCLSNLNDFMCKIGFKIKNRDFSTDFSLFSY